MYDGIFEDVKHVEKVLAARGHDSVDKNLVFELLENSKDRENVVKVLLGNWSRSNLNPFDNSGSSIISDGDNLTVLDRNPFCRSMSDEDSLSSNDLEVIEDNMPRGSREFLLNSEPVDLTVDDNQSSSSTASAPYTKSSSQEDGEAQKEADVGQLVDLTMDVTKTQQPSSKSEESKDTSEAKGEEADADEPSTTSEDEMGDYYRTQDPESDGYEGFAESDDKISPVASPGLGVCQNFENPGNNDASNPETGENRMDEMLEENNNDPNNNLEDIEVLEQNNSSAMNTQNLNIQKELIEERCASPKPGCSKDSYYADTDFCMTESGSEVGYGIQKIVAGKRQNVANMFEDDDFLVGNCVRLSDTKIGQDVFLIQNILPHYTKSKILNTLLENQDAINRVEIALWELLPEKKPQPVFNPKRKQERDNCPAPVKKFIEDDSAHKKGPESFCGEEFSKIDTQPSTSKTGIIKPAILIAPETKKNLLRPPKFECANSKPVSPPAIAAVKHKSSITLKPSKLKHLNFGTLHSLSALNHNWVTSKTVPSNENGAVRCKDANKNHPVSKMLVETVPLVQKKPEKKLQDQNESNPDNRPTTSKSTIGPKDNQTSKPPKSVTKERYDVAEVDLHETTAISVSKKIRGLKKALKDSERIRSSIEKNGPGLSRTMDDAKTGMKVRARANLKCDLIRNELGKLEEVLYRIKMHTSNAKDREFTLPQNAAFAQTPSIAPGISDSNVKTQVPIIATNDQPANVRPQGIESKDAEVLGGNKANNELKCMIVQRIDNIQLANKNLFENGIINNKKNPGPEEPLKIQLHPQPNKIEAQLDVLSVVDELLGAAGSAPQEPWRNEVPENPPPKELFNPLINMFPDVDPNYITELCISAKARNENLESLIEVLLVSGLMYPRIINPEPEPQDMDPDTQFENLQGIFPDAHPEYLRSIAEQYYDNPDAMKDFVQAKLEKPDYPTTADYLKKIKITEQIRQYTVDFSAEKFLEIFPDPFTHFENPQRTSQYNPIAMTFLKCHFKSNKINTIQRAYRQHNSQYNITLAAKYLDTIGPDMKSRRSDKPLPTEDIPLLQEFAFITHKAEIKKYMEAQKLKEQEEFQRLKKNNELLECQCCYDEECMPSKCNECSEGHIFCSLCIKNGSETRIGDGQTSFPCFVECKGEFTLPVLQKVLAPTMFSILLRKRQEEEVKAAGLEGLVSCPFCHFASIPPPEDKVFKCLNPECMKESCRLCKELNHVPLRCDEVSKEEEARHYLEEKMTEALVRKCYSCSRPFFKDEGCNKMTCPCGAMTCYICGEPVKDYRHFNGQGSDRTDLCPLWSDNKVLNAQTVRVVAEAAQQEILKQNPSLKIDAKALMPSLPQATRGPHQDIANAHVLPVRARRV